MRLVEIAGHNVDPRMVADVGPIKYGRETECWCFTVCANGAAQWNFRYKSEAQKAKWALLDLVTKAYMQDRAACCVSRPKHDPYDKLIKAVDAEVQEASDARAGIVVVPPSESGDDDQHTFPIVLSKAIQTGKESNCSEPSDALVGVEPTPELRAMPGLDSLMRKE